MAGTATNNQVLGNRIGTDPSGTRALPNTLDGIRLISGPADNVIGGLTPLSANLISGNGGFGVELVNAGTTGNQLLGNFIGTDTDGIQALRNVDGGIRIRDGASSNTIGGGAAGARNVISGHNGGLVAGITLSGAGTNANKIQGNYIGTDKDGLNAIPNTYGVFAIGAKGTIVGVDGNGFGILAKAILSRAISRVCGYKATRTTRSSQVT